jgi:TIR domain
MACVYEYDVFISYLRGNDTVSSWVRNHFYPQLCELLDNNVDYEVSVFFDENSPIGADWPSEYRRALQRTRVLVPVCSPKYFNDEWCLAEWLSMERREKLLGAVSHDQPRTLIYPVIFSDSETFPPWAKNRRMLSLKTWNQPYPHFQESHHYFDFRKAVELVAEELTKLIDHAPEWRADWPVLTPAAPPLRPPKLPRF